MLFKEKIQYIDPLNVIFLCGSKYAPKSGKDKRFILKEFMSKDKDKYQTIILEENFVFAKSKKGYLAYDDIFLNNLTEVEKLASLYADKIIIIHETISTAAEIGMLAGENTLISKMCILVPDDISIEEDKMSSFIKLAFFNHYDKSTCKPTEIRYYPDVETHRSSKNKSEYHMFFHENKIGKNLGSEILKFVQKPKIEKVIKFEKILYNKPYADNSILSYSVDKDKKKVNVSICANILKIQLLSMFTIEKFRTAFRKEMPIKDHVTYIEDNYEDILLSTICNKEGLDFEKYSIQVKLTDINSCDLRQAVGYFLYMLQAARLIGLEQISDGVNSSVRRIRISEQMELCIDSIKDYIYDESRTEFGGIL